MQMVFFKKAFNLLHPSRIRLRTLALMHANNLEQLRAFSLVPLATNKITPALLGHCGFFAL